MSKLIIAGNEIIPGTILITANNSTITPKDDLRVILSISAVGAVTLSDGTDTTQRVEVFNTSSSACSITYRGSSGNVTYSLRNASGMTLLWTGTYWKATIAGLITGTDANGATLNYTSEATIDLHEEPVQYSTTEQDTGKTWIDGKAIYRKVYDANITTYTDGTKMRLFRYTEVDWRLTHNLINASGYVEVGYSGGGYEKYSLGSTSIILNDGTAGISSSVIAHPSSDSLMINCYTTKSDNALSAHFYAIVEYTKVS